MKERPYTDFYIRLLGSFGIWYQGKQLCLEGNLRSNYLQLLLILLQSGPEGVTRKRLVEMLQRGSGDWTKQLNILRQQVFGLRRALELAGFPAGNYITVSKGVYRFSQTYTWMTDTGELDGLYVQLKKEDVKEEKKVELLREICHAYTGAFLPVLDGEEWAAVESAHYQNLYFDSLSQLCDILKERRAYEEMLELCTVASEIHPYDEWQSVQIDCLMARNRYVEALRVYEKATETFYEELGVSPFDSVMARYRSVNGQIQYTAGVMTDLKDVLTEQELPEGAYYCNYPSFIDVFHTMCRLKERGTVDCCLLVCTLEWRKPEEERPECAGQTRTLNLAMEQLRRILLEHVRSGDIFTRYSPSQFLVLLTGMEEGYMDEVTDRIKQHWSCDENLELKLYVQSVDEMENEGGEPVHG